jgi:hypothetical protein
MATTTITTPTTTTTTTITTTTTTTCLTRTFIVIPAVVGVVGFGDAVFPQPVVTVRRSVEVRTPKPVWLSQGHDEHERAEEEEGQGQLLF